MRGFTLVELLIATSLGAVLLVAAAHSTGVFGQNLAYLTEDSEEVLEAALVQMAQDVRYAWWVRVPNDRTLVVADPAGRETMYSFRQDRIVVVRPDLSEGLLVDGLTKAVFTTDEVQRWRKSSAESRTVTWWSAPSIPATPGVTTLESGEGLGLGFTAATTAPFDTSEELPEVTEQLLLAELDDLSLPLALVGQLSGTLAVSLYRGRAPGDGRPSGSLVARVEHRLSTLPPATVVYSVGGVPIPPPVGAAWDWWKSVEGMTLQITPPAAHTTIDLSGLATAIQPGRAYTLVLEVNGTGMVVAATHDLASAVGTGVARVDAGGTWTPAALSVARSLDGRATVSDTVEDQAVSRVGLLLRTTEGDVLQGSAAVLSQALALDPWAGTLVGELPDLPEGG